MEAAELAKENPNDKRFQDEQLRDKSKEAKIDDKGGHINVTVDDALKA